MSLSHIYYNQNSNFYYTIFLRLLYLCSNIMKVLKIFLKYKCKYSWQ